MTEFEHSETPYAGLGPDQVLDAVESLGLLCDGRLLALNSYENRVYQIGMEEGPPLVGKFYRPGRWSDEAILEEHAFSLALAAEEIPVVAPLAFGGRTLFEFEGYRFALFPRRGGHAPELDDADTLRWLGRFLGRIHSMGRARPYAHRRRLSVEIWGDESRAFLLQSEFLPVYLRDNYAEVSAQLLEQVRHRMEAVGMVSYLRIHGDCHPGNILWTDNGPHFVDFDDSIMGPAVQDIWMLLSGERHDQERQLGWFLEGYEDFALFDALELGLIEALRSLRIMHYAAWLARRWHDPAFPQSFPWFDSPRFWEEHVQQLREQIVAFDEPMLSLA